MRQSAEPVGLDVLANQTPDFIRPPLQYVAESELIGAFPAGSEAALLATSAIGQLRALTRMTRAPEMPTLAPVEFGTGPGGADTAPLVLGTPAVEAAETVMGGTLLAGNIEAASKDVLWGVYRLIGARKQSVHTGQDGQVVWRAGRYNAKDVVAQETYTANDPRAGGKTTLQVQLVANAASGAAGEQLRTPNIRAAGEFGAMLRARGVLPEPAGPTRTFSMSTRSVRGTHLRSELLEG